MRRYIRHPSDIPIEYRQVEAVEREQPRLTNVSLGGFAFTSRSPIPLDTRLRVRIPFVNPPFEALCRVVWCRLEGDGNYEVGLAFEAEEDAYRVRMVEQVCHIEHYKREVLAREGRELSGEEAAMEWIRKYAKDFPELRQAGRH